MNTKKENTMIGCTSFTTTWTVELSTLEMQTFIDMLHDKVDELEQRMAWNKELWQDSDKRNIEIVHTIEKHNITIDVLENRLSQIRKEGE